MGTFATTVQDIFRLLAQPLHVAAIFPATVWVLLNTYLVLPIVSRDLSDSPWWALASLVTVITFSYLLYTLNGPLIRLAEGYTFEWTPIGEWRKRKWRSKYNKIVLQIRQCDDYLKKLKYLSNQFIVDHPTYKREDFEGDHEFRRIRERIDQWASRKRSLEAQRQFRFPPYQEDIIPTGLGNIVAASESYAYNRYGIDTIHMWPRLTPILQAQGYATYLQQEKAAFDFLLNLGYISLFIGIELTFVLVLTFRYVQAFIAFAVAAIIAYGFYKASHSAAIHWGGRMKVAFDLYREPLREALRVRKPISFDDERNLWRKLSSFYRSANTKFEEFDYYRQSLPIVISEKDSIQVSKVIVEEDQGSTRFALIIRNTQESKAIAQVKVIDFVESDFQPCNITVSDPQSNLIHQRLDEWANAYQWILSPIAGGATVIVTYSISPLKSTNLGVPITATR